MEPRWQCIATAGERAVHQTDLLRVQRRRPYHFTGRSCIAPSDDLAGSIKALVEFSDRPRMPRGEHLPNPRLALVVQLLSLPRRTSVTSHKTPSDSAPHPTEMGDLENKFQNQWPVHCLSTQWYSHQSQSLTFATSDSRLPSWVRCDILRWGFVSGLPSTRCHR